MRSKYIKANSLHLQHLILSLRLPYHWNTGHRILKEPREYVIIRSREKREMGNNNGQND